jgi:hypothetical protein
MDGSSSIDKDYVVRQHRLVQILLNEGGILPYAHFHVFIINRTLLLAKYMQRVISHPKSSSIREDIPASHM